MMKWLTGLLAVALTVAWTVQAFSDGRTGAGWGGVAASVVLVALVAVWAVLARGNRKAEG